MCSLCTLPTSLSLSLYQHSQIVELLYMLPPFSLCKYFHVFACLFIGMRWKDCCKNWMKMCCNFYCYHSIHMTLRSSCLKFPWSPWLLWSSCLYVATLLLLLLTYLLFTFSSTYRQTSLCTIFSIETWLLVFIDVIKFFFLVILLLILLSFI